MNKFYVDRVTTRKSVATRAIREVCDVIRDVLKEVELEEPRFISSLTEVNGHYEGLRVISPNDFEVVLYLSQMAVFDFVDCDRLTPPGCSLLKLSDGRKRSMSLWVEFITASGYLSSRKIRSRFHTLVCQAIEKTNHRETVTMIDEESSNEVRLRIRECFIVLITPAFNCTGMWPRSAADHWPAAPDLLWPSPRLVAQVKAIGFNLLSKEPTVYAKEKQSSSVGQGDAWVMSFHEAESLLLAGPGCRSKCLSILKTLCDRQLNDLPDKPIDNYQMKTLLMYECEKHPMDCDWIESCIGDRLNGILLQLISCLQNRRCPHYFLPAVDLMKGKPASSLDVAAKHTWRLLRELLTNSNSLEKL